MNFNYTLLLCQAQVIILQQSCFALHTEATLENKYSSIEGHLYSLVVLFVSSLNFPFGMQFSTKVL